MLEPEPAAAAAPATPRSSAPAGKPSYGSAAPGDLIPLTQARKIIAERMVESKHNAPHAWTMVEVDVTKLWTWRSREKDTLRTRERLQALTLLPFFIRAVVNRCAPFR